MFDEDLPRNRDDIMTNLCRQPLDTLSVEELTERISLLQSEIERAKKQITFATSSKASAEALFRKS